MKKQLHFIISIIIFTFIQFQFFANVKINDNGELIVAYENLSDKQLIYFDELVSQIPGVKNTGYCQRMKIYIFSYDKSVYRTDEEAFNAITLQTKKFLPLLKLGTPSEDILRNCNKQN